MNAANFLRANRNSARPKSDAKPLSKGVFLFIGAVLLVLASVEMSGSPVWFAITTSVAISAIAALALTVLIGWAGQPSLLAGALMLAGGVCAVTIPAATPGSFILALIVSAVVGAVVGAIAALPSRRLSGTYLLLSTMALQFVVVDLVNYVQSKSNRTGGYSLGQPNLFFFRLNNQSAWLWVSGIAVLLVYLYFLFLRYNRVGRSLAIIRDDPSAASVAGVKVSTHLSWIFIITSALISMAGAMDGYYTQNVTYAGFGVLVSISFFVMVVIGGPGSLMGAILGCAFVVGMPQVLPLFNGTASQSATLPYIEQLLYGVLGMIVLIARFGSVPIARRIVHLFSVRSSSSALKSDSRDHVEPSEVISNAPGDGNLAGPSGSVKVYPGGTFRASEENNEGARPPILRLSNLQVSYKGMIEAVRGVNLTLIEGGSLAIVGPNGAGKTSVLSAVAGFPAGSDGSVSGGEVVLSDSGEQVVINNHSPEVRGRLGIAFVPAEDKVFNELLVHEHLRLATPKGFTSGEIDNIKADLFDVFPEVRPLLDRRAGLLSGGQRQQLALMCALMRKPRILVVDELSLGLSPVAIERVVEALLKIKRMGETSLLLAEQNVSVAFSIADQIAVMSGGSVKSIGASIPAYEDAVRRQTVGEKIDNYLGELR